MNCICCGAMTSATPYRDEFLQRHLQHCRQCGHVQLEVIPSEELIHDYYTSHYTENRRQFINDSYFRLMRKRATAQINFIKDNFSLEGTSVADVGCGYGLLLAELERVAGDAYGIEFDPDAIDYCRAHVLRVAALASERDLILERQCDLVTLSHVFEHFLSPAAVLQRLGSMTRFLFVEVPVYKADLPEQYAVGEGHINFFTLSSLEQLFLNSGFDIHAIGRYGPAIDFFWRNSMQWCKKPLQMITRDYFMNRYELENPEGIWIRALISLRQETRQ